MLDFKDIIYFSPILCRRDKNLKIIKNKEIENFGVVEGLSFFIFTHEN